MTRNAYEDANTSTWDWFSRRAGVVRGLEQWEERLEAYADDLGKSDREYQRADAPKVRAFLQFIRDLHRDLTDHPESATWSEHLAALDKLLHRYVEKPEPILDALSGLGRFDALGTTTTHERFFQAVIAAIENLRTDEVERGQPAHSACAA